MLLSNIQDNLAKSPIVAAAQSAQDEQAKTENSLRQNEALDLARKAEEEIRDLKQSENETIRDEQETVHKLNPDEEKKKRRQARQNPEAEALPPEAKAVEKSLPLTPYYDGQPHIDLEI